VWVRAGSKLALPSPPPANGTAAELPMMNGGLPDLQRDTVVPVSHKGELLGTLAVIKRKGESLTPIEQKLLADLAHQAGLVLKNVGLARRSAAATRGAARLARATRLGPGRRAAAARAQHSRRGAAKASSPSKSN